MEPNPLESKGESGGLRDLSGTSIGRYRIQHIIGSGGMGEVYRAQDTILKRPVAIKRMTFGKHSDAAFRRRFILEAQNASALNDPRIAAVHDVLEQDGEIFLIMEFVEGCTLRKRLASPMTMKEFVETATECAQAVAIAHAQGIVHHDIKPENIMITPGGRVKILDFGVARRLPREDATVTSGSLTTDQISSTGGTLTYMAPEVLLGRKSDARADVFSMGLVYFEMLAARHPFQGETVVATVDGILHARTPPLTPINPDAPAGVCALVESMLAKKPEDRPSGAAEVADRLLQLQAGAAGGIARRSLPGMGSRRAWMLGLAIFTLILLLLVPSVWRSVRSLGGRGSLPQEKILVVLPLTNLSGEGSGQELCDGFMEVLPSSLTRLWPELQVISASEVRENKVTSVQDAREKFHVTLAINGSMRQSGGWIRMDINLVNASTLRQIDSRLLKEEIADLESLCAKVLGEVARMLRLPAPPDSMDLLAAEGDSASRALESYLKGRGFLLNYDRPGSLDRAIEFFLQSTREDPNYALAFAALGEAYWGKYLAMGDSQWLQSARSNCQNALKLNSRLGVAHVLLGRVLSETGNHAEAVAAFQRALELDAKDAGALRGLAAALAGMGRAGEAEARYREAIRLRPADWDNHNALGEFYLGRGRFKEAEAEWLRVTGLRPRSVYGYSNLGALYMFQERWPEAKAMFEKCVVLAPDHVSYSNLGALAFQEGDLSEAASLFEKARDLNPRDYRLWGNLGGAQLRLPGGEGSARRSLEEALRLAEQQIQAAPDDADALAAAADYCSLLKERSRALSLLARALKLGPENMHLMYMAAQVHEQLGNRAEALLWLGKALDKGYPRSRVERSPALSGLRKDAGYRKLIALKAPK